MPPYNQSPPRQVRANVVPEQQRFVSTQPYPDDDYLPQVQQPTQGGGGYSQVSPSNYNHGPAANHRYNQPAPSSNSQPPYGRQENSSRQDSYPQDGYTRENSYPHQDDYPRQDDYSRQDNYPRQDPYSRQDQYSRQDDYSEYNPQGKYDKPTSPARYNSNSPVHSEPYQSNYPPQQQSVYNDHPFQQSDYSDSRPASQNNYGNYDNSQPSSFHSDSRPHRAQYQQSPPRHISRTQTFPEQYSNRDFQPPQNVYNVRQASKSNPDLASSMDNMNLNDEPRPHPMSYQNSYENSALPEPSGPYRNDRAASLPGPPPPNRPYNDMRHESVPNIPSQTADDGYYQQPRSYGYDQSEPSDYSVNQGSQPAPPSTTVSSAPSSKAPYPLDDDVMGSIDLRKTSVSHGNEYPAYTEDYEYNYGAQQSGMSAQPPIPPKVPMDTRQSNGGPAKPTVSSDSISRADQYPPGPTPPPQKGYKRDSPGNQEPHYGYNQGYAPREDSRSPTHSTPYSQNGPVRPPPQSKQPFGQSPDRQGPPSPEGRYTQPNRLSNGYNAGRQNSPQQSHVYNRPSPNRRPEAQDPQYSYNQGPALRESTRSPTHVSSYNQSSPPVQQQQNQYPVPNGRTGSVKPAMPPNAIVQGPESVVKPNGPPGQGYQNTSVQRPPSAPPVNVRSGFQNGAQGKQQAPQASQPSRSNGQGYQNAQTGYTPQHNGPPNNRDQVKRPQVNGNVHGRQGPPPLGPQPHGPAPTSDRASPQNRNPPQSHGPQQSGSQFQSSQPNLNGQGSQGPQVPGPQSHGPAPPSGRASPQNRRIQPGGPTGNPIETFRNVPTSVTRPNPALAGGDQKPPPVRQYPEPADPTLETESPAPKVEKPVTVGELESLRQRAKLAPNSVVAQLEFAKKLGEAALILTSKYADPQTPAAAGKVVDAKAERKNRDVWNLQASKIVKKIVSTSPNQDALFYLASNYGSGGLGLDMDYAKAYDLYGRAAKMNHAESVYRLAVCSEIGAGTKPDPVRALQLYRKAAQLGEISAMYKVAMISLNGLLGQPRAFSEGLGWLEQAAKKGNSTNPHAIHELGLLQERGSPGDGFPKDESKAFDLFVRAAKLGYPPSQFRLGSTYEYGSLGCAVDPKRSIAWYSRAAERGEPESELALSGWYLTGSAGILQQSDTEAYLWARKAAEKGLAKAEYALAYFTEVGIGVKADTEEAKRWYFKAAAQKHPKALARLQELRLQKN